MTQGVNDMLCMAINRTTQEIYMGKTDDDTYDDVIMTDVFYVNFVEVERKGNFVPVPTDFMPPAESLLTKTALDKWMDNLVFSRKDYWLFSENEIKAEMINWYARAMAQKSGIAIVGADSKIIH
jgi:hypothetical protein